MRMKLVSLTRYMEMTSPSQARLEFPAIDGLRIVAAGAESAELLRSLYREIGQGYMWVVRRNWSVSDFERRLSRKGYKAWIAEIHGETAGFIEMHATKDGDVQFDVTGVRVPYRGRGLGKYLISLAVQEAWKLGPKKVFLVPRTYEHAHAVPNYVKRGFKLVKVRPTLIGVPPGLEQEARKLIEDAKKRGDYPPLWKRVEAYLRESIPGRAARWTVYYARMAICRLRKRPARNGER